MLPEGLGSSCHPGRKVIVEPDFTIGIEEEYLLVDPESRDLVHEAPKGLLKDCQRLLGAQATPEFLQSQIEVGTRPCGTIREVRDDLIRLRKIVADVADQHGAAMIASSTHPFANCGDQLRTDKPRYRILARDLQGVARRLLISGMHVHVGIANNDLRIDLMSQARYFLPHLLALSTSSPFWEGANTGLMSYRIAVWDELPRTGLPPAFDSYSEYERHVNILVNTGLIKDATQIWWDIRPSARFPTLEMRVSDVCTRLEDAVCVAAIYLCWLRMLYRLRVNNQRWRRYSSMLINENRWLAQRYGFEKGLVDFGEGRLVPYKDLIDEFFDLMAVDIEHFDCAEEVAHARTILARGTSAHWQLRTYRDAKAGGMSDEEALKAVVDMLIHETLPGR